MTTQATHKTDSETWRWKAQVYRTLILNDQARYTKLFAKAYRRVMTEYVCGGLILGLAIGYLIAVVALTRTVWDVVISPRGFYLGFIGGGMIFGLTGVFLTYLYITRFPKKRRVDNEDKPMS